MSVSGGQKLAAHLQKIQHAKYPTLTVGFFGGSRYLDGTSVPVVAAKNEFGIQGREGRPAVPARPFMRRSIPKIEADVTKILKAAFSPQQPVPTPALADRIGLKAVGTIQREIVGLTNPRNSPVTIQRKGSSNPLVDTGQLRKSVTHRVTDS